jgi:hypothetical protein
VTRRSRGLPAAAAATLLLIAPAGCARHQVARNVEIPAGDAVWFSAGVPSEAPELEPALAKGGFTSVFLPAARLSTDGGPWLSSPAPPPARAFARPAVFLVVESDPPGSSSLASAERAAPWAQALRRAIDDALARGARYGRVAGVHLEVPFRAADLPGLAAAATFVRSRMPAGMPLTLGLHSSPGEKDREAWESLAGSVDGFVAHVFGAGGGALPAATDALARPWWAAYDPTASGTWTDAGGQEQGALPEEALALLTDDPRVEFLQSISLKEESDSNFLLKPRASVTAGRWTFPRGSHISFRQPSLADMIDRMGRDLAGRRYVRGRIVRLSGGSEGERIFTLGSLVAVLSGGAIEPEWKPAVETGRGSIQVSAENPTPNSSVVSRTSNWVEVEVGGGVTDVQAGGFDRYEVFGADGSPVLLGRATRVRFYETLVQPFEKIQPARIAVRRVPSDCCAIRAHLVGASGKEVSR